jgi:archaellum component FlaC
MARLVDFSSYYKDDNTGIVQALRKQVDNTLTELNQMDNGGWSSVYGDNRTAALEDLKKYYEELMENLEDVLELQKEIHESYLDMMDEAQEKFDEQIKSYEMISDLIDHDMQVISLVYGEESYGQLAKYYDKQQQNFNSQLDFQRQQVNFWRAQLDALDEGSDA